MRLLLPMRISHALRRATSSPVSRAAATHSPKYRAKAAAPPSPQLLQKQRLQQLQQLWQLSKASTKEIDPRAKKTVQTVLEGKWDSTSFSDYWISFTVKAFSEINGFETIAKILEAHGRFVLDKEKVPDVRLVIDVIWAAVQAKSLGSLPPSILDWIEKAVRRLPEPIPPRKESMIWLLSILRDDFPTLQRLQQESCSKVGRVGPEFEKEKTLRHLAMTYLEAGKKEEFRSLWTSSGAPMLAEDEPLEQQQSSAMLHHAMLRRAGIGKSDPAILRWYAESLVANQRTPVPERPQFEEMMLPVIRALGGRIEKWKDGDRRTEKLRKWRDDYDDAELDKLVHSMLDHLGRTVALREYGSREDLSRLGRMLIRLSREENKGSTVVVDWLNYAGRIKKRGVENIDNLLPSHELVIVGRERESKGDTTVRPPKENHRIKVIELTVKKEKLQEADFVFSLLTVASRGHLLTNDKARSSISLFKKHLMNESRGIGHSILLKNYLNDAVLRYNMDHIQPVVDHSKAAQWIDKDKKELAFTVAYKPRNLDPASAFRTIHYYSLHID